MERIKGLTLETSAFKSLYGAQFTLSTQSIKPNYNLLVLCHFIAVYPPQGMIPSHHRVFLMLLFLTCDLDCIHHILCDQKTCLGLWKTGVDTKRGPGVTVL